MLSVPNIPKFRDRAKARFFSPKHRLSTQKFFTIADGGGQSIVISFSF